VTNKHAHKMIHWDPSHLESYDVAGPIILCPSGGIRRVSLFNAERTAMTTVHHDLRICIQTEATGHKSGASVSRRPALGR